MPTMEAPDMAIQDRIVGLEASLRKLADYLVLINRETSGEITFLWDFEMIFEAIYPFASSSVYSGVLWYGLECLRQASDTGDISWRIVIPEGSRRELEAHLEHVRERYVAILKRPEVRALQTSDNEWLSKSPEYNRPDYKPVSKRIDQLRTFDEAIHRLLRLLRTYARPMPYSPGELPQGLTTFYQDRIGAARREAGDAARNEADALNLANTDLLNPPSDNTKRATLITATRAVTQSGREMVRDPIFFALTAILHKNFPIRKHRTRVIEGMIARLYSMAGRIHAETSGQDAEDRPVPLMLPVNEADSGDLDESTSEIDGLVHDLSPESQERIHKGALTKRYEMRAFMSALEYLYRDPVLVLLTDLMSQANQAATSARFQSKSIDSELEVSSDLSGIGLDGMIGAVLDALKPPPRISLSLRWEIRTTPDSDSRYALLGESKVLGTTTTAVLEGNKLQSGISADWRSFDSLPEFCAAAARVVRALHYQGEIAVLVRLQEQPGAITESLKSISAIERWLKDATDGTKLSLLRLDVGTARIWFDPGELYTEADFANVEMRSTRFAMHAYDEAVLEAFGTFVSDTSTFVVTPPQATDLLRQLWNQNPREQERVKQ